jgi:hypothetical protein
MRESGADARIEWQPTGSEAPHRLRAWLPTA